VSIFLLKAKHWQIFILLITGITICNLKIATDPVLTLILSIFGLVIYFIWLMAIGNKLHEYLPKKVKLNYDLYLINSFVLILGYAVIMIITDGKGATFTGLAALPTFYIFYAFLNFLAFPAKLINSIEIGKPAKFGEYVGDFFLIVFLPIGIWFLQPRVNKIVTQLDLSINSVSRNN